MSEERCPKCDRRLGHDGIHAYYGTQTRNTPSTGTEGNVTWRAAEPREDPTSD